MAHPAFATRHIALSEAILRGEIEGSRECSSPSYSQTDLHFPHWRANYRRAELHGASLVYCRDLVFDKDYANAGALPPATNLHLVSGQNARQSFLHTQKGRSLRIVLF